MPTAAPLTVLVVEDEPAIRGLLTALLGEEGYRVVEAPTGRAALPLVEWATRQDARPCLMLLDMMLPDMDGLGVLDHLHQRGDGIPVIAMSASREHLAAAVAAGA